LKEIQRAELLRIENIEAALRPQTNIPPSMSNKKNLRYSQSRKSGMILFMDEEIKLPKNVCLISKFKMAYLILLCSQP
jgi:hypothetical protein